MRRLCRLARRVLGLLGVLLLLTAAALSGLLWLTRPQAAESAILPGLSATANVTFDADGVPRIRAANALDGAAVLGFVHARDRLFQMDLMRRAASGRLSEIAGPATLRFDRTMRILGLRVRALADLQALPAATRAMLDAYARGVNAFIDQAGRLSAPEFVLLGQPEPWTAVDSLLWGKTMGLWLSDGWHTEIDRAALAGRLSPAMLDQLWPAPRATPGPQASLPAPHAAARLAELLPRFDAPFTWPASASNAWVVDGHHTASGAPLLAGDPHLGFAFPGIWYLARIETPDGVLAGATAPGVPFLVLGHNGHVAWSFTTTGADTQDVFVETLTPDGLYETSAEPRPFTEREERIRVRGAPDQVLTVRETRHGPVISDLDPGTGPVLAVAMANLAPGDTASAGLLALNQAQDVAAAGQAAAQISAPVQNLLVADARHIGLFVTGRVPRRRSGDGVGPFSGSDGLHDWTGFASGEALPRVIDPPGGRLLNANERVAPPDFPTFLGRDWFGDWRARRIRALLDGRDHLTASDFAAMQMDVQSAFATQVLPRLRAVPTQSGIAAAAQALLAGWDGRMVMDQPQPLIFNAWIARFRTLVLARAGIAHQRVPGDPPDFLAFVLSPAGSGWCGGDCDALLTRALVEAMDDLAARYGTDPQAWRWGQAHRAAFAHPLLRALPLLGALTTAAIDTPGDSTTLDRGGTIGEDFTSVHGPSYRGIYDLADLDHSLFRRGPRTIRPPDGSACAGFSAAVA